MPPAAQGSLSPPAVRTPPPPPFQLQELWAGSAEKKHPVWQGFPSCGMSTPVGTQDIFVGVAWEKLGNGSLIFSSNNN